MQFLVLLTALLTVADAQSIVNKVCNTRYSLRPTSKIRTTVYRASITRTVSRTLVIDPRTTVTASAATALVTSTSTALSTVTAATSTDTFTLFETVTSTSTFTAFQNFTTATTVLSTTMVAGFTRTIAAPAGFTALANTTGFEAKKRSPLLERRDILQARATSVKGHLPVIPGVDGKISARQAGAGSQKEYPVGIQCTSRTTFFRTATTTSTAGGPTSTVTVGGATTTLTSTVSATGTITIVPADATRTITASTFTSTTTTSTSTVVTTVSNTVTIQAPASTQYAQCQANNQVSSAFGGNQIGTLTFNGDFTLQSVNVTDTTGAGCCTACANAANCAGYAQAPATAGSMCYYIVTDGRCDPTQTFTDTYNYYQINTAGYTVGNAQCGQLGPMAGPPLDNSA